MSVLLFDRVMETTTTTGTGTLTLGGAVTGYRTFSVVGNGNETIFTIWAVNAQGTPTGEWEVSQGTYTSSGTTLSRAIVYASSNGGSLVNFSSGTKRVGITFHSAMFSPNGLLYLFGGTGYADYSKGDILYGTPPDLTKLAIGSRGTRLTVSSSDIPEWANDYNGPNYLINGGFRQFLRGASSTARADDTYGPDCWYILTQTASVNVSRITGNNARYACRLAQNQASAQRMGIAQILEGTSSKELISALSRIQQAVRISNSQAVRCALLGWTSTEDAVTSDVVNSWTSSTYTAGNFFISNIEVIAISSVTPTADTWTTLGISGTPSSSVNNLIAFIWTEGTAAQNVTLDISEVGIYKGASARDWFEEKMATEVTNCRRFYRTQSYAPSGIAQSTTQAQFGIHLEPPMRAAPTISALQVIKITDSFASDYTQSSAQVTTNASSANGCRVTLGNYTGLTTGRGYLMYDTPDQLAFDASM